MSERVTLLSVWRSSLFLCFWEGIEKYIVFGCEMDVLFCLLYLHIPLIPHIKQRQIPCFGIQINFEH